jgi:hypothetical protein
VTLARSCSGAAGGGEENLFATEVDELALRLVDEPPEKVRDVLETLYAEFTDEDCAVDFFRAVLRRKAQFPQTARRLQ